MKPLTFFLVIIASMLFLSSLQLSVSQPLKYCPKKMTFAHPCQATQSNMQCVADALGTLGAASMPKNCICTTLGLNKHSCACQVVCH
ncbi:hypothetical protein SAY86_018578 [Trapa natans]|uniref:Uncharacterized protein n=1 Tax=Trapa natans TaxID=22666 RepID=A0AAN7LN65_TRANT|nr:hypothetical protein SAY86_018578 [Trapa natans]